MLKSYFWPNNYFSQLNSYSLILTTPVQTEITPISPISLNSTGNYDTSQSYECLLQTNGTLESGYCSIVALTNTYVIVNITHGSSFILRPKTNKTCDLVTAPIITMFSMIVLWIGLSLLFLYIDKDIESFNSQLFHCIFYHPVTGLFTKQPNQRRIAIITHITACELLLLALIGIVYDQLDKPNYSSSGFHDFSVSEMTRGAVALLLCQVFTIPIFIANAYSISKPHILKITLPVCIAFIVLSFIAIIAMTSKYCSGYTIFWIINFLIFLLLDLTTLQVIYALLVARFMNHSIPNRLSTTLSKGPHSPANIKGEGLDQSREMVNDRTKVAKDKFKIEGGNYTEEKVADDSLDIIANP